jgi:hypothetical protein
VTTAKKLWIILAVLALGPVLLYLINFFQGS